MPILRGEVADGDDSGVPTLAQLITDRKGDSGLSYEELAAKSDHVLTRQRFQQLGKGLRITEFPEPATLAAIAKSLDVDVALVVLAAAKSIGLPVETGSESELGMMLPAAARTLTRDQRNALLAVVRSIVSGTRDKSEDRTDFMGPTVGSNYPPVDGTDDGQDGHYFGRH